VESQVVTGIAFSRDEAQITLRRVADRPGIAAAIFMPLAEANINVDMIIQVASEDTGVTDITFTVSATDFERTQAILFKEQPQIGFSSLHGASDVVKVSAIALACVAMPASPRWHSRPGGKRYQHQGDYDLRD